MKIGILSYPLNNNYGCYLQAYALKSVLESWGHQVTYIYRRHTIDLSYNYRIKYFVKNLAKSFFYFKRYPLIYNSEQYEYQYMLKKGCLLYPFFEKYLVPHTKPIYSTKELKNICENKFDVIIVGSDQVWRAELLKSIGDYFLVFLESKHTKRIAYAASFGSRNPRYTKKEIRMCGVGYSKFDAVSVREEDGIGIIKDFGWSGPNPFHVLDPTLILCKSQYDKLLPQPTEKKQLFCYILDMTETKENFIDRVSKELGLKVIDIVGNRLGEDFVFPSVESWLQGIRDSKYVITDSFHGTVFCIIFNVPFTVIPNKKRGASRFYSLLKKFGLESRIVDEENLSFLGVDIDWVSVNKKVEKEQRISLDFLNRALYFNVEE